jgi:hypothetical protein
MFLEELKRKILEAQLTPMKSTVGVLRNSLAGGAR